MILLSKYSAVAHYLRVIYTPKNNRHSLFLNFLDIFFFLSVHALMSFLDFFHLFAFTSHNGTEWWWLLWWAVMNDTNEWNICCTSFKVSHYFSQQDIKSAKGGKVHHLLFILFNCLDDAFNLFLQQLLWSLNSSSINYLL